MEQLPTELWFSVSALCPSKTRSVLQLVCQRWRAVVEDNGVYFLKDEDEHIVGVCEYAAAKGHLDCLRCARENGCPWDEDTCERAASGGHLDCLRWARVNGCVGRGHVLACCFRRTPGLPAVGAGERLGVGQ